MKKYGVVNCNDNSPIPDSHQTDDYEVARSLAVSLSNWNIECEIVELATGEVLKHVQTYA